MIHSADNEEQHQSVLKLQGFAWSNYSSRRGAPIHRPQRHWWKSIDTGPTMILLHPQRSPAEQQMFPARGEPHCPPLLCRVVKLFLPNENQQSTATQVEEHWRRPNDMIRVTSAVQHYIVRDTDPVLGAILLHHQRSLPEQQMFPASWVKPEAIRRELHCPPPLCLWSWVLHPPHISGSVYQVFKEDWVLHQR